MYYSDGPPGGGDIAEGSYSGGANNADMSLADQYAEYGAGRAAAEMLGGYGQGGNGYTATAGTVNTVEPTFAEQLNAFLQSPTGATGRGILSSALGPLGMLANFGYNLANSKDRIGTMLGAIPGIPGLVASTTYGMSKTDNPAEYLGGRAAGLMASYAGGKLAGPIGSQLASRAVNSAISQNRANGFSLQSNGLAELGRAGDGREADWEQLLLQNFGPQPG